MNTKSNTLATNNQQSAYANLSAVGIYNQRVKENLAKQTLSLIQQVAIKNFKDQAQRNKLTISQYNKAVEEFNQTGLLLLKKEEQQSYNSQSKEYRYINYAIFDTECFSESLKNYDALRIEKNKYAKEQNLDIAEYNSKVVKSVYDLTKEEKAAKSKFKQQNSKLLPENYNAAVEFANQDNPIHPKKKIPTIKTGLSRQIFTVCLYFYGAQLRTFNANQMNKSLPTSFDKKQPPKISISPNDIMRFTQNGVRIFDDSQDTTIRRHLRRFLEVGIIKDYKCTNSLQRARWRFNANVLLFKEGNPPKSQKPSNQSFNNSKATTYNDNNKTTRTNKKKIIKKDSSKETDFLKCGSILQSYPFYKNTTDDKNFENDKIEKKEVAAENFKSAEGKNKQLSKNTREHILTEIDLANFMTSKVLNDKNRYKPLKYKLLEKVIMYSDLTPCEISELLTQDFIKANWKLYKNHNVYFGEWLNAIRAIKNDWFDTEIVRLLKKYRIGATNTQEILTTGTCYKIQEELLFFVEKMRSKLETARKKWLKMSFPVSFPATYYNVKRTESYHLSFTGLEKIWQQQQKQTERKKLADKKLQRKIFTQKKKKSNEIKFNDHIGKYFTGKITRLQLYTYVQNNLPPKYLQEFNKIITSNNVALA